MILDWDLIPLDALVYDRPSSFPIDALGVPTAAPVLLTDLCVQAAGGKAQGGEQQPQAHAMTLFLQQPPCHRRGHHCADGPELGIGCHGAALKSGGGLLQTGSSGGPTAHQPAGELHYHQSLPFIQDRTRSFPGTAIQ